MARQGGEITAAFSGGGSIAGASTARTTPVASPYQVTDALPLLPSSPPLLFFLSAACVQLKLTVTASFLFPN
jgi:hypothetical protein